MMQTGSRLGWKLHVGGIETQQHWITQDEIKNHSFKFFSQCVVGTDKTDNEPHMFCVFFCTLCLLSGRTVCMQQ